MCKELLSIVVPCYNEENTIGIYFSTTSEILAQIDMDIEYIFVDDGSRDNTLEHLKSLHKKYDCVKYLSFSRNFGKEAALLAGLEYTKGDYVTVMDVDLQDPPEILPEMLNKLKTQKIDCVASYRSDRNGEPPIRSLFANMFYKLINKISDVKLVNGERDYRVMTRQVVDSILSVKEINRFSKGIFSWVGFKTDYVEYENVERSSGQSKWSFWSLLKYSIDGIVSFSTLPLAIASVLGIILSMCSVLLILFIVVRKLMFGDNVQGWASTICIISLFSGLQLSTLGIIGTYLSRLYLEVKGRPKYIIREQS